MKVLLLAGGFGTRLSEETDLKPKPMVEIGGKPILWHIMKIYSHYGFNEFVVLLGYKGYYIKEYFANYFLHQSDVTIDMRNGNMEVLNNSSEPWRITLLDTGINSMTGGRVKRAKDFVEDEWTTDKIAIDMSGMMDGNIIYTESYRNTVLSSWLDVNTATMPPVYTMSNQVFLIRLKDNTYAAIRFTNYMNARGIKGYIDFDFQYPLEFEDNNNETNQQE